MKKLNAILCATLLAIVAPALAENSLNYNLLEFNESATVTVPNDTMHVTLTITEQNKNRQVASNKVTRKLNEIQNKIRQNKQLVMELGGRHAYPQYGDKNKITSWEDTARLNVKSTDFAALSQLVSDVQEQAMLQGVSFSVSPQKRAKAVEQASEQALKVFQQRANFMSKNLGFSSYKIVKLDLTDSFESAPRAYGAAPMMASMRMAKADRANQVMEMSADAAGEDEIHQTIRVTVQMQ